MPPAPPPSALHPPVWGPAWWRMAIRRVDPTFTMLLLAFVALDLLAGARTSVHDITDSVLYRHIAGEPLSWAVLLHEKRPFLYPLIIRLCGGHGHLVVALQAAAWLAACGLLAWSVYRPLRDAGRVVHGALLAMVTFWVGLWPIFAGWNHLIMTESLSNSGLVAICALLLRCVTDARDRDLYAAVAIAPAVAVIRDASAYFSLSMIVPVAILAATRRVSLRAAAIATPCLLASYAFMVWSAGHVRNDPMEGRWVFPMLNDFGQRVLTDPVVTAWFTAHGMPMNDTLRSMAGKLSFEGAYEWQFYRDPQLEAFRHWLVTDGKGLYQRFVLTHPGWTLRGIWGDRLDLFEPSGFRIPFYYDPRYRFGLIAAPHLIWVYGIATVASPLVLLRGLLRRERIAIAGGLLTCSLVVLALPMTVVIDRADTMEIARHGISLPLQLSLAAVVALFLAVTGHDLVRPQAIRAMPR